MEQLYVTSSTECEFGQIVYMRGVKVDELFQILWKNGKITYNESPFKSPFNFISDIRSILPKKGCKTIKKALKYAEEMKELKKFLINLIL